MNDTHIKFDSWFTKPKKLVLLIDLFVLIVFSVTIPLQTAIHILTNSSAIGHLGASIFSILVCLILIYSIRFVQSIQNRTAENVSSKIDWRTGLQFWVISILSILYFLWSESFSKVDIINQISNGIYLITDPLETTLFFVLLFGTQFDFKNQRYREFLFLVALLLLPGFLINGYILLVDNSHTLNLLFDMTNVGKMVESAASGALFISSVAFLYLTFNKQIVRLMIVMLAYRFMRDMFGGIFVLVLKSHMNGFLAEGMGYLAAAIILQILIYIKMKKQKEKAFAMIVSEESKRIPDDIPNE